MLHRSLVKGAVMPSGNELGEWPEITIRFGDGRVPRLFKLHRLEDASGVSGTGTVAFGVRFADGKVALRWCVGEARSTSLWDSVDDLVEVHGHDGLTQLVWL